MTEQQTNQTNNLTADRRITSIDSPLDHDEPVELPAVIVLEQLVFSIAKFFLFTTFSTGNIFTHTCKKKPF